MSSKACQFVEKRIWHFIDREISAGDVSRISAHLKLCAPCRKMYEERAREASLCRVAFHDSPFGDRFAETFQDRFIYELESSPEPTDDEDIFSFDPKIRQRRWAVGLAACGIIGIVLFGLIQGIPLGDEDSGASQRALASRKLGEFIGEAESLVEVQSEGYVVGEVQAGARFESRSPDREVTMRLFDGTSLAFQPRPWTVRIASDSRAHGRFLADLEEGGVTIDVVPRRRESRFVVRTPNATVEVLGTRFTLEVTRENGRVRTSLKVEEGQVRFSPHDESERPLVVTRNLLIDGELGRGRVLYETSENISEAPVSPEPGSRRSASEGSSTEDGSGTNRREHQGDPLKVDQPVTPDEL